MFLELLCYWTHSCARCETASEPLLHSRHFCRICPKSMGTLPSSVLRDCQRHHVRDCRHFFIWSSAILRNYPHFNWQDTCQGHTESPEVMGQNQNPPRASPTLCDLEHTFPLHPQGHWLYMACPCDPEFIHSSNTESLVSMSGTVLGA